MCMFLCTCKHTQEGILNMTCVYLALLIALNWISVSHVVTSHLPLPVFTSEFRARVQQVCPGEVCPKKKVSVQLPEELDVQADNTIVFCMLTWSKHSEVRDAVLRTVHVH